MNNLLKNLGVIILIIGAVCLIASFYAGLSSNNSFTAISLLVCVVGLIVHIIMNKRITE